MALSKEENTTPSTSQAQVRKKPAPSNAGRTRKKREPSEITLLGEHDLFFFNEGTHFHLDEKLGAHLLKVDGVEGTYFAVWAPDAERVCVMGEFNGWDKTSHPLHPKGQSGIWERFFPGIGKGTIYKYHIVSRFAGYQVDKMDPFGIYTEVPPKTASVVWDLAYEWGDHEWMEKRRERNALQAPLVIYEVHLGSWRRVPEEGNRSLTYLELAHYLPEYVRKLGFTHVEFLPLMEHPFYGSWGYEVSGYFAPTSRYGTPQDLMYLIDSLHRYSIGVILDYVPAHFPKDEHALGYFDGTHLFEHADPRQGIHPDWDSFIFNYGRNEVRSFLISNALFWLGKYHADGLRIDAVASMLYLDYSRKEGEWIPNEHGGRENLGAIGFLRRFNEEVYKNYPDVQTIAEESTAWPMVSRPLYVGGLGFGLKWDMGWMHDTLSYMSRDSIHRKHHHNELTFRTLYAFSENFVLPLSHDEVVHGKGSLLGKMAGDDWQKFANLRLLLGYLYAQPGKKLLFMGGEFGQWKEWNHDASLDWHLLEHASHAGLQRWVEDLNRLYRREPALYEQDCTATGFEWIDCNDTEHSILSFLRKGRLASDMILVVCNFTPVPRHNYQVGVPRGGFWRELLNSDAGEYGGSQQGNQGGMEASPVSHHGHFHSLNLTLPPLAMVCLKSEGESVEERPA
jgi:1,4-alpha-glucan branching enzyme